MNRWRLAGWFLKCALSPFYGLWLSCVAPVGATSAAGPRKNPSPRSRIRKPTRNSLKTEEEIQTIRFKFTSFASMDFNIQHGGVPRRSRFFYRGFHFDFGPLRVALCSNDTLRLHTRLAVPQQGVCGPISAGPLSRSHNHTRPMRRPPAGRHRKHDSHSLPSQQTIPRTAAYCKSRNNEG